MFSGHVVLPVERLGVLAGERQQIAHVPDDGLLVRVRGERRGRKLLEEAAVGCALGAQPTLFHDDVALLVELAKHRVEEARRFEVGPELDLVGGQRVEIAVRSELVVAFMPTPPARSTIR
jgi:hypothetical protein